LQASSLVTGQESSRYGFASGITIQEEQGELALLFVILVPT